MTLQSSGPLKASEIEAEFGGTPPFRLSDYYAGGPNVPPGTEGDGGPIPTSGTIKFSDFYGASNIQVDIIGATLIDINTGNDAGVGYQVHSDGTEKSYEDNSGTPVSFNTWLLAGVAADFECRLTVDSGDNPTGSALGAWISTSLDPVWHLLQVGIGVKLNACTIEIRNATSMLVVDSASVDMNAEHDDPDLD